MPATSSKIAHHGKLEEAAVVVVVVVVIVVIVGAVVISRATVVVFVVKGVVVVGIKSGAVHGLGHDQPSPSGSSCPFSMFTFWFKT